MVSVRSQARVLLKLLLIGGSLIEGSLRPSRAELEVVHLTGSRATPDSGPPLLRLLQATEEGRKEGRKEASSLALNSSSVVLSFHC
jgi:hypothetical protein